MGAINYGERLARLRGKMGGEVKAAALVPGANMVYFTGLHFHLSERPTIALVLAGGGIAFIVPMLEASKLDGLTEVLDIRHVFAWFDDDGYAGAFAAATAALGLDGASLAVDDMTMRVFELLAFQAATNVQAVPLGMTLLGLRVVKTAAEVALLRQAVELSEIALRETLEQLEAGMTERQIADLLSARLAANGSHGHAFGPLVLIGEKSALPHGVTAGRELREGDLLLFDFGGTVDGYPADITRTFAYGEPSAEARAVYEAVRAANEAARAVVRPGVTGAEVDKAARDVIVAAGFGEYFIHRTGHGLGLEVHEEPQISSTNAEPLAEGMVFTIEPGVYLPGVGGVRIEDNLVVTADGGESYTTFPRELWVLRS